MKKYISPLAILIALFAISCTQTEKKGGYSQLINYKDMQQIAAELDQKTDSLHIFQTAIRDMLHGFEASFPKDTFTTKLRTQLSELNKAEYTFNQWKKNYNVPEDSITMEKAAFAALGKNEITAVRSEWNYNIIATKKLIAYF
ncbi:MAG: hypothetical protein ACOYOA_07290, partial [Saprospiraceae bacterium]